MTTAFRKKIISLSIGLFLVFSSILAQNKAFQFVFMTDIHLRPEKNAVAGFDQAIDKINQINPDFVITGGDQIDDALDQTFKRADLLYNLYKTSIKRLKMPIYNTIGNHDLFGIYRTSGISPKHPEFGKKIFTSRLNRRYYTFDFRGWHFIILDSIKITDSGKYRGEIDQEQIRWLTNHLKNLDKKNPIIIGSHVPFYSIMPQIDERFKVEKFLLTNTKEILGLFKDHNLKLVLQGHVHTYEVIQSKGIYFISAGAISANWWDGSLHDIQEGFLLVKINGRNFSWEYIDYGWQVEE